jgi:hypothetical protein
MNWKKILKHYRGNLNKKITGGKTELVYFAGVKAY